MLIGPNQAVIDFKWNADYIGIQWQSANWLAENPETSDGYAELPEWWISGRTSP